MTARGSTVVDILDEATEHNPTVMHLPAYLALRRLDPALAHALPVFGALRACRQTLTTSSYLTILNILAKPDDWAPADGQATPWQGPAVAKKIYSEADLRAMTGSSLGVADLLANANNNLLPQFDQSVIVLPFPGPEMVASYYTGLNDTRLSSWNPIRRRDSVLFVHLTINPPYVLDMLRAFQTDPAFELSRPKFLLVQDSAYVSTLALIREVFHD
jgi:hypothetical protein